MGALWLPDLPDWLAARGLDVEVWPGWLTRSRRSGGYDDIFAVGLHHDVSAAGSDYRNACRYMWETHPDRPVGALYLKRDGGWVVGAAGATNTQGQGGPLRCSRGTIPVDSGNRYTISIEAANNGTGEWWPNAQRASYVEGVAAILDGLNEHGAYHAQLGVNTRIVLNPAVPGDIHNHFEWAPARKIDVAGPPTLGEGGFAVANDRYLRWEGDSFRQRVAARLNETPHGGPDVTVIADKMLYLPSFEKMLDTRPGEPPWHNPNVPKTPIGPGSPELKVAVAMAAVAQVRIQVLHADGPGFLAASGIPGQLNPFVNFVPDGSGGFGGDGVATLAVPDGHIYLSSPHRWVHVVVSIAGYAVG